MYKNNISGLEMLPKRRCITSGEAKGKHELGRGKIKIFLKKE